jgi:hypothetical protein
MYYDWELIQKEVAIEIYKITEDVLIDKDKGWRKDYVYHVYFNVEEFEVKCTCCHFEFRGIICRHVLFVLTHKKIKQVPSQYILDRWRKNVKRKHNFVPCTYGGMEYTPVAKHFDMFCNVFFPVVEVGAMSEESCNSLIEQLHNLKIQLSSNSSCENNSEQFGTLECDAPSNGETTNKVILSPITVRCAGRPPSLRKESKVDKLMREARKKLNKGRRRKLHKRRKRNLNKRYFYQYFVFENIYISLVH